MTRLIFICLLLSGCTQHYHQRHDTRYNYDSWYLQPYPKQPYPHHHH
jgi:hypothetical protein